MGPGNSHDDEPRDEHSDGPGNDHDDDHGDDHGAPRPGSRGRLPDPLDRVWLHPSELSILGSSFAPSAPAPSRQRSRPWLVPVLASAAGALLTVAVFALTGAFDGSSPDKNAALPADAASKRAPTAADALTRLSPSVVAVLASDTRGNRRGSGVCVRHGAQVLTSMRVVGSAKTVRVVTSDGRTHTARVVGHDQVTDLVLLDLQDDANVPAAALADDSPATGQPVWLVGAAAPGAKSPWMSGGMASSNDALVVSDIGPISGGLLETDAASNTSVVGGALVDASGSVAGIVLGHVNGSATTYAVSISVAVGIARELDANGVAMHGTLGVSGVDTAKGPTIVALAGSSPAAAAGAHVKDVIESINGRSVESIGDLTALVRSLEPGRMVTMDLRRGTKPVEVTVRLGAIGG